MRDALLFFDWSVLSWRGLDAGSKQASKQGQGRQRKDGWLDTDFRPFLSLFFTWYIHVRWQDLLIPFFLWSNFPKSQQTSIVEGICEMLLMPTLFAQESGETINLLLWGYSLVVAWLGKHAAFSISSFVLFFLLWRGRFLWRMWSAFEVDSKPKLYFVFGENNRALPNSLLYLAISDRANSMDWFILAIDNNEAQEPEGKCLISPIVLDR